MTKKPPTKTTTFAKVRAEVEAALRPTAPIVETRSVGDNLRVSKTPKPPMPKAAWTKAMETVLRKPVTPDVHGDHGLPATKPKAKKAKATKPPVVPPPGPGEIAIRSTLNGVETTKNIKALRVHDFFAIHAPVPPSSGKAHVLTHVPTGHSVGRYRTLSLAMFVAAQLRAMGGAEVWEFSNPDHLAKHASKELLAKMRQLSNPELAEETMKMSAAVKPAGRVGVKPGWAPKKPLDLTPPPVPAPDPSTAWRKSVDWVAAGKKAYETRMRNLAAKQAAQAPKLPVPIKVPVAKMRRAK